MADNYLEYKREEYERRKQLWLRKQRHAPKITVRHIDKPEDEAL